MSFDNQVMVFQVYRIGYAWKTLFANPVTIMWPVNEKFPLKYGYTFRCR